MSVKKQMKPDTIDPCPLYSGDGIFDYHVVFKNYFSLVVKSNDEIYLFLVAKKKLVI